MEQTEIKELKEKLKEIKKYFDSDEDGWSKLDDDFEIKYEKTFKHYIEDELTDEELESLKNVIENDVKFLNKILNRD